MRTTIVVIVVLIAATAAPAETPGNQTRNADEARAWYQECLGNDTRAAEALQVAGGHVDHYCDMLSRLWQNGVDPEILARILLDMRREIDAKKTTENPRRKRPKNPNRSRRQPRPHPRRYQPRPPVTARPSHPRRRSRGRSCRAWQCRHRHRCRHRLLFRGHRITPVILDTNIAP